jgi:hypothetical protein
MKQTRQTLKRKERVTLSLSADMVERLRTVVYWSPKRRIGDPIHAREVGEGEAVQETKGEARCRSAAQRPIVLTSVLD